VMVIAMTRTLVVFIAYAPQCLPAGRITHPLPDALTLAQWHPFV
jgi:hypothetical protein